MLLPLLILLTGCHIPRYEWTKANATPEQLQRDRGACQMQALKLRPLPNPTPLPAPLISNNSALDAVNSVNYQQQQNSHDWNEKTRQEDYFRACMMSKGWTLQRKEP